MIPSIENIIDVLQENAEENILPYFKQLSDNQIREKAPGNLVTDADEASEIFLAKNLSKLIKDSVVVGEEAVHKDKKVLENLNGERPVWIVDPIDGTYNFTHGRSNWGVFVSLYYQQELLFGILYDVMNQKFIFANKGEGAYMRDEAGKDFQIQMKAPDKALSEFCGHVGGAQAWHFKKLNRFCGKISNIRCSMHDFWSLLTGQIDFTFHSNTTPWDHSAPAIIVREAGGFMAAGHDKKTYDPRFKQKHLLTTYNEEIWQELADQFHTVL